MAMSGDGDIVDGFKKSSALFVKHLSSDASRQQQGIIVRQGHIGTLVDIPEFRGELM